MLWGWQIQYYLSVVLACVALLAIVQYGAGLTPRVADFIVGVCAILLTLCGANGLGMVPVLALWPLALALLPSWSATETAPGARPALTLVSCTALVLSGLYFVGWEPVPGTTPTTLRVFASGISALLFLTSGLSPAMQKLWPLSGIAVILLSGFTMLRLTQVWVTCPEERARAAGFLLFLGSMASLALGLGVGRFSLEARYVVLAVPAWCCVYFVCELYGGEKLGKRVPALLAVAAIAGPLAECPVGYSLCALAPYRAGQLRA